MGTLRRRRLDWSTQSDHVRRSARRRRSGASWSDVRPRHAGLGLRSSARFDEDAGASPGVARRNRGRRGPRRRSRRLLSSDCKPMGLARAYRRSTRRLLQWSIGRRRPRRRIQYDRSLVAPRCRDAGRLVGRRAPPREGETLTLAFWLDISSGPRGRGPLVQRGLCDRGAHWIPRELSGTGRRGATLARLGPACAGNRTH